MPPAVIIAQAAAAVAQHIPADTSLLTTYGAPGFFAALLATVAYFVRRDAVKDGEMKQLQAKFLDKVEELWKAQTEVNAKYASAVAELGKLRVDLETTRSDLTAAHREIDELRTALAAATAASNSARRP